jgi:hypothetical protein
VFLVFVAGRALPVGGLLRNIQIQLMPVRKKNSCRQDSPCRASVKQVQRHYIETVFSQITSYFPKRIHAVTFDGFLLQVSCFIASYTLDQSFLEIKD